MKTFKGEVLYVQMLRTKFQNVYRVAQKSKPQNFSHIFAKY